MDCFYFQFMILGSVNEESIWKVNVITCYKDNLIVSYVLYSKQSIFANDLWSDRYIKCLCSNGWIKNLAKL